MFSDDITIENNELSENSVGLYVMYSKVVRVRGNRLLRNRGPSGYGLGLKEADQFTGVCVPHTVPNSGSSPYSTTPQNPDIPTVMGIPCAGHNSGQCIGLAEEQQAMTVTPPPAPVFGSSPTVTN